MTVTATVALGESSMFGICWEFCGQWPKKVECRRSRTSFQARSELALESLSLSSIITIQDDKLTMRPVVLGPRQNAWRELSVGSDTHLSSNWASSELLQHRSHIPNDLLQASLSSSAPHVCAWVTYPAVGPSREMHLHQAYYLIERSDQLAGLLHGQGQFRKFQTQPLDGRNPLSLENCWLLAIHESVWRIPWSTWTP